MKADLEQPIVFHKEGRITDEKSAAKSRKTAIKARRKAEQAEASAADAREKLNKGAEMDTMIVIVKSVIAGKPSTYTKRDSFVELQSALMRPAGLTRQGNVPSRVTPRLIRTVDC
jgi:hypothetical protein